MRPSPLLVSLFSLALAGGLVVACSGSDDDEDGDDPQETDGGAETDDTTPDGDATDEPEDTDETDLLGDTDLGHPCLAQGAPVVQIGTGDADFESITEGQRMVVVHGPQGGWHIDLAVRVDNMPQRVFYRYEVRHVESGVDLTDPDAGSEPVGIQLVPETSGTWQCRGSQPGILGIMDKDALTVPTDPAADEFWEVVCDDELELTIILQTRDGAELGRDSVRVNAQPDPCDCSWCGSDAGATPVCTERSAVYDECFPGVRICDRPETVPDDTDDTDDCPEVVTE